MDYMTTDAYRGNIQCLLLNTFFVLFPFNMNIIRCTQTHEIELELASEESTWVLDFTLITINFYLFYWESLHILIRDDRNNAIIK